MIVQSQLMSDDLSAQKKNLLTHDLLRGVCLTINHGTAYNQHKAAKSALTKLVAEMKLVTFFKKLCATCNKPSVTRPRHKWCSTCCLAWYCSPECQRAAWPDHKQWCSPNYKLQARRTNFIHTNQFMVKSLLVNTLGMHV